MAELKPCPRCGSTDCRTKRHHNKYCENWWSVKCYNCEFEKVSKLFDMPIDAIDAWNRRAKT